MKMRKNPTTLEMQDDIRHHLTKLLEGIDPVATWPTCASCHFLMPDDRTCEVFGKQPPVSVVVKGCTRYSDKTGIPF